MILQANELTKTYTKRGETIRAIDGLNLAIDAGYFIVIHGHSGSGKSTLLLMLGGMLRPTTGEVVYDNFNLYARTSLFRSRYRKETVGFVFQKFHLMPYLTVMDNIRLSMTINQSSRDSREKIYSLTDQLGIRNRLNHLPEELSVGEQQRVALARTLVRNPPLLLADEPTGNLDSRNTKIIADCLKQENESGKTIILATHNKSLIELGNRRMELLSGRIVED